MEGHPRYEDPGAIPAPGRVDSSDAARKRMFLLLDAERRSLAAQVRPSWRLSGRYEDLSLVMILARLERDWLSQPRPDLSGGDHPKGHGGQPGPRLADWAKPWGAAPRIKLDADIGRVEGALNGIGRWLPAGTAAKAEGRARDRLEAITAEVEERDPQARAAADASQGGATKRRGFERPSRTGVAAIAGFLLLVAGAGAFLLASHPGSRPGDSVGRQGAVAGTLDTQNQGGSGQPSQGARPSASPPGHPGAKGSARARPPGAGQGAPVASETVPPAPEPPPVSQPVAAPQPAPASQPAPAPAPSSSTSRQSKSAGGGGGCPPEFGYEC